MYIGIEPHNTATLQSLKFNLISSLFFILNNCISIVWEWGQGTKDWVVRMGIGIMSPDICLVCSMFLLTIPRYHPETSCSGFIILEDQEGTLSGSLKV